MNPRFPMPDVTIVKVAVTRKVEIPTYADDFWQMNQHEFAMQVEGMGSFYACNGNEVEYAPLPEASKETIELYLNGSVYGAILHQRQILPLHGSSFTERGKGVLICGESGTGKSSLTAAFCLNGSEFLTDDVTPVIIRKNKPYFLALSDRIKLWDNALEQLKLDRNGLYKIDPETEKFYYPMKQGIAEIFPFGILFILEINDLPDIDFIEVNGAEKFLKIRNEIYRWEYLQGMKENEVIYFRQIAIISNCVKVFRVKRPEFIEINRLSSEIRNFISRQ